MKSIKDQTPSKMVTQTRQSKRYSRLTFGTYHVKDPIKYSGVSTPVEQRCKLGIQGLVPSAYIYH